MVMVTKTAISDYLLPRQPMSLKAELKSTIILIPLFLSNCVFKILSCGTVAAQFRANTFLIFPLAIGLLHLPNILACCCKIGFLTLGSPKHMIKLLVIQKEGRTTKQSMTNFLYNNTFWFIFYTLLLSIQMMRLPQEPSDPEEEGLPHEIFQALCGVIFVALVLNILLIYFQLWRPFKVEQNRREDIESSDAIEEEGSSSAWFCLPAICVGQCGVLLIAGLLIFIWVKIVFT